MKRIGHETWLNAKVKAIGCDEKERADVRLVFRCEIIWRTLSDGKANDGFGWCVHRRRGELEQS